MSNANKYPTTVHREEGSVQLHDGGSGRVGALIDNALANLTRDQARTLAAKAADAALTLEIKAREQNLDYVAGKKALEDHLDAFRMLDRQGHLTRHTIETVTKTGAGTMRVESKAGATCFVATATYGGIDHPNVRFLRKFRDDCLMQTPAGRSFVGWYWREGPRLARWVGGSETLKSVSRCALSVLVAGIRVGWRR